MEPSGGEGHGPADFDTTFREQYEPMVRSLSVACGDREVGDETTTTSRAPAPTADPAVSDDGPNQDHHGGSGRG